MSYKPEQPKTQEPNDLLKEPGYLTPKQVWAQLNTEHPAEVAAYTKYRSNPEYFDTQASIFVADRDLREKIYRTLNAITDQKYDEKERTFKKIISYVDSIIKDDELFLKFMVERNPHIKSPKDEVEIPSGDEFVNFASKLFAEKHPNLTPEYLSDVLNNFDVEYKNFTFNTTSVIKLMYSEVVSPAEVIKAKIKTQTLNEQAKTAVQLLEILSIANHFLN
jgi:hypothetical protein